ncbi:MAG: pyridoxal phosphate-dependent aminotransferase [Microscillaceae bacterium]
MQATTTPSLVSKLPHLGTTIFSKMTKMALDYGAVNLSQGFPDFEVHPDLIDRVYQAMRQGLNQYAPMAGMLALREQIAQKTAQLYGYAPHPEDEITVTSGASEAIFNVVAAVVRPGDEVVILEPAYDLYRPVVELFGGKVLPVALRSEDFSVDWPAVARALRPNTRMLIYNTPHNPSGKIWAPEDLHQLTQLVRDTDILLISDEVYEHIVFDGQKHLSVLAYPELRARSFVVFSFGKTFHATGWRIGYCVAPAALSREFRKVHQYNTFSTFTPAQVALAEFLKTEAHYLELPDFYQARRDRFRQWLSETPFELLPCEGGYFQIVSYAHLSSESDLDYAERLTREVGVATIPLSPFYSQGGDTKKIRFCFAKKYETLEAGIARLHQHRDRLFAP